MRRIISFVLVAGGLISGCTAKAVPPEVLESEHELDNTLVTGKPCAPPCWFNITPGITTGDEAVDTLRKMPFVDSKSIFVGGGGVSWRRISSDSQSVTGGIPLTNNVVESVNVRQFMYPPSLGSLVDALGPPEGAWVEFVHQPNADVIVILIWPKKGVRVESQTFDYDKAAAREEAVEPSLTIRFVEYVVPYDSVNTHYSSGQLRDFQIWGGFSKLTLPK